MLIDSKLKEYFRRLISYKGDGLSEFYKKQLQCVGFYTEIRKDGNAYIVATEEFLQNNKHRIFDIVKVLVDAKQLNDDSNVYIKIIEKEDLGQWKLNVKTYGV